MVGVFLEEGAAEVALLDIVVETNVGSRSVQELAE